MYRVHFIINPTDEWCAVPNVRLFYELCRRVPVKERTVATIRKKDTEHKICLGSPNHIETEADYVLWVPSWFYAQIEVKQEMAVLFSCSSSVPRAHLLTFTTESDIPPDIDLREILESVFSQLGILKRGQVFPVPVLENIYLTAEFSEPYVFLHGDEVEFDVAKLVRIPDVVELPNVPDANVPDATFNTLFEPPPVARNLFPGKGRRLG